MFLLIFIWTRVGRPTLMRRHHHHHHQNAVPWSRLQTVERLARTSSGNRDTSCRSQGHLTNLGEKGLTRPRHAVSVCTCGEYPGKSTAELPLNVKASARIVALGCAEPDVLEFTEMLQQLITRLSISCWLSVPASDERNGFSCQHSCKQHS